MAHHAQAHGGGCREWRALELHGDLEADETQLDGTTSVGLRSGASVKADTTAGTKADTKAYAGVDARLGAGRPFLRLPCLGGQSEVVLRAVWQLRLQQVGLELGLGLRLGLGLGLGLESY